MPPSGTHLESELFSSDHNENWLGGSLQVTSIVYICCPFDILTKHSEIYRVDHQGMACTVQGPQRPIDDFPSDWCGFFARGSVAAMQTTRPPSLERIREDPIELETLEPPLTRQRRLLTLTNPRLARFLTTGVDAHR